MSDFFPQGIPSSSSWSLLLQREKCLHQNTVLIKQEMQFHTYKRTWTLEFNEQCFFLCVFVCVCSLIENVALFVLTLKYTKFESVSSALQMVVVSLQRNDSFLNIHSSFLQSKNFSWEKQWIFL